MTKKKPVFKKTKEEKEQKATLQVGMKVSTKVKAGCPPGFWC